MTEASDTTAASEPRGRPGLLLGAVHLGVLWAFAFQRPLFDLLGDNPDFFVARGNTRWDIIAYAFAFTFVPPLMMLAVEWVALRIRGWLYEAVHLTLVGLLAAAFALQLLKDNVVGRPAGVLIVVALGLGALFAYGYRRTLFEPQALTFLSPAPIVFLAVFLLFSPAHKLILPQGEAEASERIGADAPVVVLYFDEFPVSTLMNEQGGIDARRFPNFAELAAHSTWYRNATTVADKTPRAVPAMLTGKNPGYHRLPIASDQPPSLFTELGAAYKTHAIETATRMCPGSVCPGGSGPTQPGFGTRFHSLVSDLRVVSEHLLLPGALARNLPPIGQTVGGFGNSLGEPQGDQGSPTVDARYQQDYDAKLRRERRNATPGGKAEMFSQFVAPIGGAPRNLYFLDIQLPHFPWEYVQTAQQYPQHFPDMDNFVIDDPPGRFIRNRWLVDQSYARHMLQAGATDKLLGTLIRRMKQAGIWDKALITVSADHGVSFHPGGFRREVKAANLADIAFVPLFVKAPGQNAAREVDRHTCTTDIPGLITRALGVEIPWHADRCDPDRIAVLDSFGGTRDGELARAEARRAATVRRKFTLFGEGWAGVYGFGPAPELIGKQVKAFQPEPARRNRIRFDEQSDVSDVDPRGAIVPALLQATINFVKAPAAGLPLAVAVNGRIAATTRAYELRGKNRFIALLEPRFYRPGRNSVEVFTISGSRRPRLESLGGVNLR